MSVGVAHPTVHTSAKSRLTRPGVRMRSVMARTARRSTPSAMRKAVAKVVSGEATSSSLWLGTTISVSTSGRSSSRPSLHGQRQAESTALEAAGSGARGSG